MRLHVVTIVYNGARYTCWVKFFFCVLMSDVRFIAHKYDRDFDCEGNDSMSTFANIIIYNNNNNT